MSLFHLAILTHAFAFLTGLIMGAFCEYLFHLHYSEDWTRQSYDDALRKKGE